jgi:LmbE family N-acetylglucosaminyl deacetylase
MARILLLIPHPDDEVVGMAATIAAARDAGDTFFGLYLTDGIPAPEQLWRRERRHRAARAERRCAEARAAAQILGIEPVAFCGWPSRSLKAHLGEAAARIAALLSDRAIAALWVPAWEGGHQDHDAANFLAARTAGGRPITEFAEYNRGGGGVRWNRFVQPNGSEIELNLSPAQRAAKRSLLALYGSERANLSGARLKVESRRPLPAYDYARRPHEGALLRERFHWVGRLVRHPRVDFEPSAALYDTLKRYR